jgi:sugar-specific transcriptional regulator TrmB
MTTRDEFAHRLIGFGLSEKEALVYLYLLMYGPNTQSRLAKALKTYREDVRRTLNSLIGKSMVVRLLMDLRNTPQWTSTPRLTLR